MIDKNITSYNHSGETVIQTGAFKYKGPCPLSGLHIYQWAITVYEGKKIGTPKQKKNIIIQIIFFWKLYVFYQRLNLYHRTI